MKTYFLSVYTIGLFCCCICKAQDINTPLHSHVRIITPDGKVYAKLAYTTDCKKAVSPQKNYAWFDSGVITVTQGGYAGKLLNGEYTLWYLASKQLKEQGYYSYGLKHGVWKYWDATGHLQLTETWKQGLKNGESIFYDSLGREKERLKLYNNIVINKRDKRPLFIGFKDFFKGKKQ